MKFILLTLPFVVSGFKVIDFGFEPEHPKVGGKALLKCRSSSWFEYCTWTHGERVCNFEWKRSHRAVKKQTCSALNNRAHYRGTYDSHECDIEIQNLTLADQGEWRCRLEGYVYGDFSGEDDTQVVFLKVFPDPTSPTTITTTTLSTSTSAITTEADTSESIVQRTLNTETTTTSIETTTDPADSTKIVFPNETVSEDPPSSTESTTGMKAIHRGCLIENIVLEQQEWCHLPYLKRISAQFGCSGAC